MDARQFLIVLTTFPDQSAAHGFARQLVDKALCACVHIHSTGLSIYRWQDKIQEDAEVQLIIKCLQDQYVELEQYIKDHHPYDVPECIAISLQACSDSYGQWLNESANL